MKISDFNIVIELDESKMAKVVGGSGLDAFLKIDGIAVKPLADSQEEYYKIHME